MNKRAFFCPLLAAAALLALAGAPVLKAQSSYFLLNHSGGSQTAAANTPFPFPVEAQVINEFTYGGVNGAQVRFDILPGSTGASGTFPTGTFATVTTANVGGFDGIAMAPQLTATGPPGMFQVRASLVTDPNNYALFQETVAAGGPAVKLAVLSVNGGTNSIVNQSFSVQVAAEASDGSYTGVSSATTVSLSLKTGTGTLGGNTTGVILAGTSIASIPGVTYSKAESGVVLTATRVSGDSLTPADSAPFTVDPASGPPATILATNGTPQSAQISTSFAAPLEATVLDGSSKPVSGALVTFSAPAAGASGTFPSGNAATTDGSGRARVPFTANTVAGGPYTVTANVSPPLASPAQFSLTNTTCAIIRPVVAGSGPLAGIIGTVFSATFGVTVNGVPTAGPYTFSAANLPPGLSLSLAGQLSGTPSRAGSFTVTISVAGPGGCGGSRDFTIAISCPASSGILLTPTSLPHGVVGVVYGYTITASGGRPPYRFQYPDGLPPGLSPAETTTTVTLAGSPALPGNYSFSIEAHDSEGCIGSVSLSVVISASPQPDLRITVSDGGVAWGDAPLDPNNPSVHLLTYTIEYANVGTATATGVAIQATPDRASSIDPAAGLLCGSQATPCNLFLGSVLAGEGGTISLLVRVSTDAASALVGGGQALSTYRVVTQFLISEQETDAEPSDNQQAVETPYCHQGPLCGIVCPLQFLTCAPISVAERQGRATLNAMVGDFPAWTFLASGGNQMPYTFSAVGLPPGLTMHSLSGVLSGSPLLAGQFPVTIYADDTNGCEGAQDVMVNITTFSCIFIEEVPDFPAPRATVGVPYELPIQIEQTGGPACPQIFTGDNLLPPGFSFTVDSTNRSKGILLGTFTDPGLQVIVTQTARSCGHCDELLTRIAVEPASCSDPGFDFGPATLPDAIEGQPYSQSLSAQGGTPPFSFTLIPVPRWQAPDQVGLPAGLTLHSDTGIIDGTPFNGEPLSYRFQILATDAAGCVAYHVYDIGSGRGASPSRASLASKKPSAGSSSPTPSAGFWSRAVQWGKRIVRAVVQTLQDLNLFYRVRDQILAATPGGQRYINLYYSNAAEITGILMTDASARDLAVTAAITWEPGLRALVDGHGGDALFTQPMADSMTALLEKLKQDGSGGLQATIAREQAVISFSSWVGLTMDEALREFRRSVTATVTIPAVASIHGRGSSFFHSDVRLLNPGVLPADVSATYHPLSGAAKNAHFTVAPSQQLAYDDIVAGLFQAPETGGAVEFTGSAGVIVASRLYTPQQPLPAVGQFVPGLAGGEAFASSILTSLSHSADAQKGSRTNIGVFNGNESAQTVRFQFFDPKGNALGTIPKDVPAHSALQLGDAELSAQLAVAELPDFYCRVQGDGIHPLFASASVVDNQSQDPIFMAGQDGSVRTGGTTTLSAVASLHGAAGTFFHSDVRVLNTGASTADVTAVYRCWDGGCGKVTATFSAPPGEQLAFDDIVASLFNAPETAGAVEFWSPSAPLVITSRLYTPSKPAPTVGMFVPGLARSRAFPTQVLPSLSHSADPAAGFRTNIGLFNANSVGQNVTVSAYDPAGRLLGRLTQSLGPRAVVQIGDADLARAFSMTSSVPDFYCVVAGDRGLPLFAYAAVADNRSQDPTFISGSPAFSP